MKLYIWYVTGESTLSLEPAKKTEDRKISVLQSTTISAGI